MLHKHLGTIIVATASFLGGFLGARLKSRKTEAK